MKREQVISEYLVAVQNILIAFRHNREPEIRDIGTVGNSNVFTDALRELYLSDVENKDSQYELIFRAISSARLYICQENFIGGPYQHWRYIITSLDIAYAHISELHFKESDRIYPYPSPKLFNPHPDISIEHGPKIEKSSIKAEDDPLSDDDHAKGPLTHYKGYRITANHHVLSYIFDCHATGTSIPKINEKTRLESIGNSRIGARKGHRFYRVFDKITANDLNSNSNLIQLCGDYWKEIVIQLSHHPEEVKKYLESKGL